MGKRSSGEGTIVKRADGRWAGAISLPDGSRKWCYGKTQQEVARKIADARRDRDSGLPISSERRTVGQYLETWLEMRKLSVRPGAYDNYVWYCRRYIIPTIGKVLLTKLTGEHVQRLLAARLNEGLAPSTVRYTYAVLRNALNEAVSLGLIARNVALMVKKPRARRIEMRCWDPEQARRFLDAAKADRLYALYVVALSTGMREGELLALRWHDITLPPVGDGAIRCNIRCTGEKVPCLWKRSRRTLDGARSTCQPMRRRPSGSMDGSSSQSARKPVSSGEITISSSARGRVGRSLTAPHG